MLYSIDKLINFWVCFFHTTKEEVRELIPHMGLISEVIIIISEQNNNHGKSDFPYVLDKFYP